MSQTPMLYLPIKHGECSYLYYTTIFIKLQERVLQKKPLVFANDRYFSKRMSHCIIFPFTISVSMHFRVAAEVVEK